VRDAFARLGWEAVSADILSTETMVRHYWSSGSPNRTTDPIIREDTSHYMGDVRDLFDWGHPINAGRAKQASNYFWSHGQDDSVPLWNLTILHPPCDDMSYAGARWFKLKDARRGGDGRMQAGLKFFGEMIAAPSPLVCVENPHSVAQEFYGRATQVVQPWHFGDPKKKQIHLWLKGLPPLWHDNIVEPIGRVTTGGGSWRTDGGQSLSDEDSEGRKNRARVRSRTSPGLARAMAEQWAPFAEAYYRERDSR
jgi:hypothetical protein